MELNDQKNVKKQISLLEGDGLYFNRILHRDSSVGQSSRIYYPNVTDEGVPFEWEKQPGTPKHPRRKEAIPPPSPPPAAAQGVVGPPFKPPKDPNRSNGWRWFWERSKKVMKVNKKRGNNMSDQRFEYGDFNTIDSSRFSSSSSCSLSTNSSSSLNGSSTTIPPQQSFFETWKLKGTLLLVCVAKPRT